MINIQTVKFMKLIEDLKELSRNGIKPFSECTENNKNEYVFYDEKATNSDGTYKICLDICVCKGHHDIISYYEHYKGDRNAVDEFIYGIALDESGSSYINIKMSASEDIVIENGNWDFT